MTVLRSIPNNILRFRFDIPSDFYIGTVGVFGQISLDNNSIIETSINPLTSFIVSGGSKVKYVANSVTPFQAVSGESVTFNLALIDSGSTDLKLLPDSTYLQIGFAPTVRTYLAGNFILNANDTTYVVFKNLVLPSVASGPYDLRLHTVGTLFGRDTLITGNSAF